MERLVTTKKLKSSLPQQKVNVWIIFAFENVSLTSSAASLLRKSKVITFSFKARARHLLLGCTARALILG
jgi:hypothetical protein